MAKNDTPTAQFKPTMATTSHRMKVEGRPTERVSCKRSEKQEVKLRVVTSASAKIFDSSEVQVVEPPSKNIVPAACNSSPTTETDEVLAVGTVNEQNLPHMRQHCTRFPFDSVMAISGKYDGATRASNFKHCDKCYCYVCDRPVNECSSWESSSSRQAFRNHCCATDTDPVWRVRRVVFRGDGNTSSEEEVVPPAVSPDAVSTAPSSGKTYEVTLTTTPARQRNNFPSNISTRASQLIPPPIGASSGVPQNSVSFYGGSLFCHDPGQAHTPQGITRLSPSFGIQPESTVRPIGTVPQSGPSGGGLRAHTSQAILYHHHQPLEHPVLLQHQLVDPPGALPQRGGGPSSRTGQAQQDPPSNDVCLPLGGYRAPIQDLPITPVTSFQVSVSVQVPPNSFPGRPLQVQNPATGLFHTVTVPPGFLPGSIFCTVL